jgi:hypothetical protein
MMCVSFGGAATETKRVFGKGPYYDLVFPKSSVVLHLLDRYQFYCSHGLGGFGGLISDVYVIYVICDVFSNSYCCVLQIAVFCGIALVKLIVI